MNTGVSNEHRLRLRKLWFGCGFLLLILVAVVSLAPVPGGPEGSDKVAHVVLYAILAGWFSLIVNRFKSLIIIFSGLTAYGLLMEYCQGMTAYRSMETADAIANGIGAGLGLIGHFTPLRGWLIQVDRQLSASR